MNILQKDLQYCWDNSKKAIYFLLKLIGLICLVLMVYITHWNIQYYLQDLFNLSLMLSNLLSASMTVAGLFRFYDLMTS